MNTHSSKPNVFFWIIGVVALLWNLAGVSQFFAQAMNAETWRANFTPELLEIMDNLPLWYIVVFAVAVFASTLASVMLLVRRKLAVPLYLVGLIAVIIQSSFNLFVNEAKQYYGAVEITMTILLPIFSAFLYFYVRRADSKGWLK